MMKDTLERTKEPNLNLKGYLQQAYMHPIFKDEEDEEDEGFNMKLDDSAAVPTKRQQSRKTTPVPSRFSGGSSPAQTGKFSGGSSPALPSRFSRGSSPAPPERDHEGSLS